MTQRMANIFNPYKAFVFFFADKIFAYDAFSVLSEKEFHKLVLFSHFYWL